MTLEKIIEEATLRILRERFLRDGYYSCKNKIIGIHINWFFDIVLDLGFSYDSAIMLRDNVTDFIIEAINEKIERKNLNCERAEKTQDGKCVGYQISETDDEPCKQCRDCTESQFYEVRD